MVNFKQLSDRAKDLVEKRGGTDSLKQDAEQLKNIAKGPGSISDKAKAAAEALKEPGGNAEAPAAEKTDAPKAAPAPADEPSGPAKAKHGHKTEAERAERKAERKAEREAGGNDAA